jgi:glycosyltransferase involved in cell wall biosynthesis
MPKFSIVVPVYNVEKYVKKCLDSIFNQSFKDFEVIVVNDGTKDNSMDIVKDYDVTVINQKNQGLSEARNNGVKKAKGDYLIFIDSDDYIEEHLLKNINDSLDNNPDVVRFQAKEIIDNNVVEYPETEFKGLNGKDAFKAITGYHYVEPAWLYAIKRKYYISNKYSFKKGTYHEDFGLTPLIVFKSKVVNSINYCGYCYVQRSGSIMTNKSYDKTMKKVDDVFNHYKYLIKEVENVEDSDYFKSFLANSVILKITELNKEDYKKYKKMIKEEKVFDNILNDTFKRKIKKSIIKRSPKLFKKINKGN